MSRCCGFFEGELQLDVPCTVSPAGVGSGASAPLCTGREWRMQDASFLYFWSRMCSAHFPPLQMWSKRARSRVQVCCLSASQAVSFWSLFCTSPHAGACLEGKGLCPAGNRSPPGSSDTARLHSAGSPTPGFAGLGRGRREGAGGARGRRVGRAGRRLGKGDHALALLSRVGQWSAARGSRQRLLEDWMTLRTLRGNS